VDQLALEVVDPRNVGHLRPDEQSRRVDEITAHDPVTVLGLDPPDVARLVVLGAADSAARADLPVEPVALDAVERVGPHLLPRRIDVAPIRLHLEGVGVDEEGHVDFEPRVVVLHPGAAELGLALEDHEVVDADPVERDAASQPREARADDHDLVVEHRRAQSAAPLSRPTRG
jgi:hypothetical protein